MNYVTNSRGLKIAIGSPVRYIGTGTIGVVKAIDLANGKYWALLDTTNLYYDIDYLEPIEKVERKSKTPKIRMKIEEILREETKIAERATEVTPSGAG